MILLRNLSHAACLTIGLLIVGHAHAHDIGRHDPHLAVATLPKPTVEPTSAATRAAAGGTCAVALAAFEAMAGSVTAACDNEWLTFETATGLPPASDNPADTIMVGITAWIQRVPLPFNYNWRLPSRPTWLDSPEPASARGPIAVAIDGVPIFHYDKRPDADTSLAAYRPDIDTVTEGELDQCGGHAGQGDDYHYHYAPICLLDRVDPDQPIGFGMDGVPIYFGTGGDAYYGGGRYNAIDRLPAEDLDDCNGARQPDGTYVYYTTREPPYVIGCHHAAVDPSLKIEPRPLRDRGQRSPSPLGIGEIGEPVRTLVTGYFVDDDGWHHLEFDALAGSGTSAIVYRPSEQGPTCWDFQYRTNATTATVPETACR